VIAALAAIGLAWWSDHLVRWLALAVALTLAPELLADLRSALRTRPGLARLRRWAPHAVLVVVAGAFLHELVLGHPPATRDHGIHYFQARILVDDMLPALSGWNDRINHGYPYGEGYPTLGYLWVSAVHLLTGGAIDLRTSYAWGLLGVWVLTLWGVWHVAALVHDDVVAGEPDVVGRSWAGCLGALAWLLDPGESRQGGWEYLMFHGVWPQALSSALWVASIVLVRRALVRPSPRVLALAALAGAGSLLAHPFGLLTTAGSLFGWLVVLAVAPDARALPVGRFRVVAIVHALAVALAAGGVATFLTAAGEMGRTPVGWSPLGELVAKLAIGDLFGGPWGWIGVLTVVGLALALWCARSFAWLVAGLVVGMLLLASHESLTVLRLDLVTSAFKNLQFSRYAIAIKPVAFALVGTAAVLGLRGLSRVVRRDATPGPWARRIFVAVLLAPVLATLLGRLDALAPRPIAGIDTLETSEHGEVERSLREALIAEREATGPLRVAFLRSKMGGGMFPLFAIADAGGAVVLDGHVPTVNFVHTVEERSPFVLARLGVTHVIHDRPIDDEPLLVAALEPVGTHGPYTLARFTGAAEPFATLDDSGTVEIVERSTDEVVLDVAPKGPTRLVLAWAPSERWAWTVDGEPRDATTAMVRGGGLELLALDVDRPGRVVLHYVRHERERIAAWVSWGALVLVLLGLAVGRPIAFVERLHSPTALSISRGLAALSVAIVVGLVVRRQHAQLADTWDEYAAAATKDAVRDPIPPFVDDLTITGEVAVTRTPARTCDGLLGKDPLTGCHESEGGPYEAIAYVEPYLYRCTQFSIVAGGQAEIVLGDAGDEVLALLVRRGDHRGRHVRYEASGLAPRAGTSEKALVGRAELRLRPADEPARIVVTNDGDDTERVCVAAARFGP